MATDGHAAAPAAAGPAAPKKGMGARIWGWVGAIIVVFTGLIVLFLLTENLTPMVSDHFNGTMSSMVNAFTSAGKWLGKFGMAMGVFGSGGFSAWIRILVWVGMFAITFVGLRAALKKARAGGGGGH